MSTHESSTIVSSISLAGSLPIMKHSLHPYPIDPFHAGTMFLLAIIALLSGRGGNGDVREMTFIDTVKVSWKRMRTLRPSRVPPKKSE